MGGYVFPQRATPPWEVPNTTGLSKRELFAAIALQGLVGNVDYHSVGVAAEDAVKFADALIAELAKEPPAREEVGAEGRTPK